MLLSLCQKALEVGTLFEYKENTQIMEVQTKSGLYWARVWSSPEGKLCIVCDMNGQMIEMVKEGGIMLDIGANVGRYAIPMATKAKQVYAFEPEPNNVNELKQNTEYYRDKISVVASAVSNHNGGSILHLVPRRGQHSMQYSIHSTENIIVTTITIDKFVTDKGINPKEITGIKIDVEGAEQNVLEGALTTLMETDALIALETHTGIDRDAIYDILTGCGYRIIAPNGEFVNEIIEDCQYLVSKSK